MYRLLPIPYTLQFKHPAATSRGALRVREVVLLRVEHDGVVGWGECGVIPGLSRDDRSDYVDTVRFVCDAINRGSQPADLDLAALPSVAFGLETALLDLAGGGRQRLFDTPFSRGKAALPIHGLIWMDSPAGLLDQIDRKIAQGCRVIKLKVGALPWEQEMALLAGLRWRWPDGQVELRLDANGAWTPDEALARLDALADLGVAFLEQPIQPGQPGAMAAICATSPIPIALDEELISAADPSSLLEAIRPQHVMLKPSLLGGLAACERWISAAGRLGIGWWVNSLLESNVGLNAIAQWTSAQDDGRVHGLGTGQLFSNNVPSPLWLDGCGLRHAAAATWDFSALPLAPGETRPAPTFRLPLSWGEGWGEDTTLPYNEPE